MKKPLLRIVKVYEIIEWDVGDFSSPVESRLTVGESRGIYLERFNADMDCADLSERSQIAFDVREIDQPPNKPVLDAPNDSRMSPQEQWEALKKWRSGTNATSPDEKCLRDFWRQLHWLEQTVAIWHCLNLTSREGPAESPPKGFIKLLATLHTTNGYTGDDFNEFLRGPSDFSASSEQMRRMLNATIKQRMEAISRTLWPGRWKIP